MQFSVEKYEQDRAKAEITPSWNNKTFQIAYIDADGNKTIYSPSASGDYTLTGTDKTAGTEKTPGTSSNTWMIQDNGGMYDLVVKVDADGKPTSWYYQSDPNRLVAYKASSTSNWTTEGFLYCVKKSSDAAESGYCKNFFGTIPMVNDEEFKFIVGNNWLGQKWDSDTYGKNVAIAGTSGDAPNLKNPFDGIYPIELNFDRTDYQLAGNDQTPLRIFMIGSALNSNLSNNYSDWDPANAVELVYDTDEQCYKGTVSLAKNGQFRFLRDTHSSGSATSLDLNFGEDANAAGGGVDTDDNNYVAYNSTSTSGTNVVFNPETNIYNVRFYIEAGTNMSSFNWNDAKYRYTIELPARLNATITPTTATVNYAASLTPKVSVVGTDAKTRTYAYTTDGTNPTINATTGEATGKTKVVTYTYDTVIPSSDLGTFYMAPGNVLTFIDNEGKTTTLTGTSVTVKAQAVQTITDGSKYRLEGDIATGNYTFETAGVQPGSNYTISIKNENEGTTPSVNKAIADVTVTNSTTNADDGVDVYYTTDGSDPASSTTARLVRNRQITVYALPETAGNKGTIKVVVANTSLSASCDYDITYSTSEGGYQNYLNNSNSQKTLGGDGHVVVYVKPFSSDANYTTTSRKTYVYAYEKLDDDNGSYASLTHAHRFLTEADKTSVKDETWYALDLEPASNYKEVNVLLGYYDGTAYKSSDATVANACQDMFLKFDVATGQITDVTRAYTGDHFYTTGTKGTKSEAANPASNSPFFYAQVPLTWTSNGNSVKVFKGDAKLDGATVDVQNGAETSELSSVCKISVPTSLADKTVLTLKPYNGETASNVSFTINYQNGGYYFYESANHYSTTAPLVFTADADGDQDQRSYGRKDINHVTTGDKTNYLSSNWTYSPETESKTTTVKDNWNGKEATVNTIAKGTTISQTVSGLSANTSYTVQMIVRGKSGATGKLSLNDATEGTATDSKSFTGYDAAGTITTDGRVEALLSGTNNGWQKLEATANTTDDGKLTISLAATGAEMELSDVTLLEKANTDGYVWTKAPTSNETTEYDLSKREKANAFSFFDRGDNKNAIVYANANTVLGMSSNTYDVAVSNGDSYTMNTFALTDQAQDGTKNTDGSGSDSFWANAWKYNVTKSFTASNFAFDRHFTQNKRSTICVPVALSEPEIKSLFGTETKVYDLTSVDVSKYEINATEVTTMEANHPYIIFVPANYDMRSVSGSFAVSATGSTDPCKTLDGGYTFYSNYEQKTIYYGDKEKCYNFGSAEGGRFYRVKYAGVVSKPFRAYIKANSVTANAKMFTLNILDNTTTGVNGIQQSSVNKDAPIYTLSGVRVADELNSSLAPGVYIQNGKKIIVK